MADMGVLAVEEAGDVRQLAAEGHHHVHIQQQGNVSPSMDDGVYEIDPLYPHCCFNAEICLSCICFACKDRCKKVMPLVNFHWPELEGRTPDRYPCWHCWYNSKVLASGRASLGHLLMVQTENLLETTAPSSRFSCWCRCWRSRMWSAASETRLQTPRLSSTNSVAWPRKSWGDADSRADKLIPEWTDQQLNKHVNKHTNPCK